MSCAVPAMSKRVGLYVHIPFCATKCPYCDFYSVKYSSERAQRYVDAVILAMKSAEYSGEKADTLYFGGGTPSLLKPHLIRRMVDAAVEIFDLSGEVTLEANPDTLNAQRMADYIAVGINRFSIGMQSANPVELAALGRRAAPILQTSANVSFDIMLGTPYQTIETLEATLSACANVSHVSAYMLKIEENTPYYNSEIVAHCADDDDGELYKYTVRRLGEMGFVQYEISNFAKAGYESRHNLKYWLCDDYIGFGASAHSCYKGRRFYYPNDIDGFISGMPPVIDSEAACGEDERIMLGLRLSKGIDTRTFASGDDILRRAKKFERLGLLTIRGKVIALTTSGFLLSNPIIAELM